MEKKFEKKGPVETFYCIIASTRDILYPHEKPKLRFTKQKWCVINFTNAYSSSIEEAGEKETTYGAEDVIVTNDSTRKIVGALPFIQTNVLYILKIQSTYMDAKYGWSWMIQGCYTSPNYNNPVSVLTFIKQFGVTILSETDRKDKKIKDKLVRRITKDVDQFVQTKSGEKLKKKKNEELQTLKKNITSSEWNEFMSETDYGQTALRFVNLMRQRNLLNDMNFEQEQYRLLARCYNIYSLFIDNTFWDELTFTLKSQWENLLKTPESAFRMCIRALFPIEFRYLHQQESEREVDHDNLDTAFLELQKDLEDSKEDNDDEEEKVEVEGTSTTTKKERRYGGKHHHPLQKIMQKHLSEFLQFLKLDKAQSQFLQDDKEGVTTSDWKNRKQTRFHYIPELSLRSFKSLCDYHKWKEHPPKENELGLIDPDHNHVPELSLYFKTIEAYRFIHDHLMKENQCGICIDDIPPIHHQGLEYLVKQKVLYELEMPKVHNQYHACEDEKQQITGCSKGMSEAKSPSNSKHYFLYLYARLKIDTMNYLDSFHQQQHVHHWNFQKSQLKHPERWDESQLSFFSFLEKYPIFNCSNPPGMGKTELLKLLDQCATDHSILVTAFPGRAVGNVQERLEGTHIKCLTNHSILKRHEYILGLKKYDLLVLEESSMPSELLLMQVLAIVPTRQIMISGDVDQTPAFDTCRGAFFRQMMKLYPNLKLAINYRQLKDPRNLIIPNLKAILNNEFDKVQWDSTSFRIRPFESGLTMAIQRHTSDNFEHAVFLCGTRDHVRMINERCILSLHPNHPSKGIQNCVLNTFFPKDQIMITKNTYRIPELDRFDMYLNADFYFKTYKFTEKFVKTVQGDMKIKPTNIDDRSISIGQNGTCDTIEEIFQINDWYRMESILQKEYMARLQDQKKWKTGRKKQDIDKEIGKHIFDMYKFKSLWSKYVTYLPMVMRCMKQNEEINKDRLTVLKMRSGRHLMLSDEFSHSYACGRFKFQGSQKRIVYICLPNFFNHKFLKDETCRNTSYTGVSRGEKEVTFLTESTKVLQHSMNVEKMIVCGLSYFQAKTYDTSIQVFISPPAMVSVSPKQSRSY